MTDSIDQILFQLQDTTTFGFNEIRLNPAYETLLQNDKLLSNTLELFCFGDYLYYLDNQPSFLVLTPAALKKLKQLTLISEALKNSCFSYEHLKSKVAIDSNSELERLITESIYHNLIEAKINSHEQLIKINSTKGRDILLLDDPNFNSIKKQFPEVRTDKEIFERLRNFKTRINKANKYLDEIKDSFEKKKAKMEQISTNVVSDSESSTGTSKALSNMSMAVGSSSDLNSSRKRKISNK